MNTGTNQAQPQNSDESGRVLINDGIFVKPIGSDVFRKIAFANILYFCSSDNHIHIHTVEKLKVYPIKISISNLEHFLGKYGFYRCHRSYLVNLWKVEDLSKDFVGINAKHIPIGKDLYDELVQRLLIIENKWS
jgi:DNA-binding LytR/AlgR family response regulator